MSSFFAYGEEFKQLAPFLRQVLQVPMRMKSQQEYHLVATDDTDEGNLSSAITTKSIAWVSRWERLFWLALSSVLLSILCFNSLRERSQAHRLAHPSWETGFDTDLSMSNSTDPFSGIPS
jgi:hypothetical protein